jgi:hypothetical protein
MSPQSGRVSQRMLEISDQIFFLVFHPVNVPSHDTQRLLPWRLAGACFGVCVEEGDHLQNRRLEKDDFEGTDLEAIHLLVEKQVVERFGNRDY